MCEDYTAFLRKVHDQPECDVEFEKRWPEVLGTIVET
jgi:hypothetical protein